MKLLLTSLSVFFLCSNSFALGESHDSSMKCKLKDQKLVCSNGKIYKRDEKITPSFGGVTTLRRSSKPTNYDRMSNPTIGIQSGRSGLGQ